MMSYFVASHYGLHCDKNSCNEKSSLGITICHHSASLVIPNSDPQDGFFYLALTLTIDSYNLNFIVSH